MLVSLVFALRRRRLQRLPRPAHRACRRSSSPSARCFIIRGVTIGITRQRHGPHGQSAGSTTCPATRPIRTDLRQRRRRSAARGFSIAIVWWLGVAAVATWVLLRTSFGNWIFGVGGNVAGGAQRRRAGHRWSRSSSSWRTAAAAWLVAMIQVLDAPQRRRRARQRTASSTAIIAVVIGGTLLTGGYGSAIGAVFGALIFGMVRQGIVFAGVDPGWVQMSSSARMLRDRGAGQPLHPHPGDGGRADDRRNEHAAARSPERLASTSAA